MNNNIDFVISNLDEYRHTHPNLIRVLTSYLKLKQDNLQRSINLCNKIIENLNDISDPELSELLVLFNLLNNSRE